MGSKSIINFIFVNFLLAIALPVSVLAQTSSDHIIEASSDRIIGPSQGNHRLDCTIIRPWDHDDDPGGPYPVIGWTNGWGGNNVAGANINDGYESGWYFWAETGDYIVVAANQWSARSPDILQCLQWLLDENNNELSKYYNTVIPDQIGVSGHSQGGGAALKAGDEVLINGTAYVEIKTVVAMNPYGPSFVKAKGQNGQILLLGGDSDGVTPTASFSAVLEDSILSDNMGGVQAELVGGTHCDPVCHYTGGNFGIFGTVSLLWFDIYLKGVEPCDDLIEMLEDGPGEWNTEYSPNFCPPPP